MAESFKSCLVDGCNRNAHSSAKGSRGWCNNHYALWRRKGTTESSRGQSRRTDWLLAHRDYDGEGCLEWPFASIAGRYGATKVNGRSTYAHRVMCELVHGPAPTASHEVAHSCGKGHEGCVHPKHLRWATHIENQADQLEHGTRVRGERIPWSKLTEENVREIRQLFGSVSQREIASRFNVSWSSIQQIKQRKTWHWVE